jgi:hypothetical protein
LLISTSTSPSSPRAPGGVGELTGVTDVGLDHQHAGAESSRLLGGLVQFVAGAGQQRDPGTGLRQTQRNRAAEAVSGSGHERGFAVQAVRGDWHNWLAPDRG